MRNSIGSGLVAVFLFLMIAMLTRLTLVGFSLYLHQISVYEALCVFLPGLVADLFPAAYIFLSVAMLALLTPSVVQKFLKWSGGTRILWMVMVSVLLMTAVGEVLFWDEFGSRFNFIAVDYLLYTHEVMHNIIESYPLGWILVFLFVLAWCIVTFMQKWMSVNVRKASGLGKLAVIFFSMILIVIDVKDWGASVDKQRFTNRYANELASSGMYLLFYAFRNNILDYNLHYQNIPLDKAVDIVRDDLHLSGAVSEDPIARQISDYRRFRPYNVVLIMVESLSNHFLEDSVDGSFLTPYLRSLYPKSLYFSQHYATGTRTVRGLEAFSLAVPPTPGSSIVRRANNEQLYSVGSILRDYGYQSTFAYGGIGFFDNMNAFFRGNGYEIFDQTDIPISKIYFSNAWGVADEILFDQVLERSDELAVKSKPFFMHIMTTSNHRPYTFPDHPEVTLAQGSREAAVQYTDFAIGRFIEAAKKKPWFKNTIFVITADHCASSAGKSVIDVSKYHIPWIIYAPFIVKPARIDERSSQMDMAPTILGLLRANYESHFFGLDKLKYREDSLITLGTFQNLGFWKKDRLTILSPKQRVDCFRLSDRLHSVRSDCQAEDVDRAVAWYELASHRFKNGMMKQAKK